MKKSLLFFLISGLFLFSGCINDTTLEETSSNKKFTLIDTDTKQTVSTLEYSNSGTTLKSFSSYDEDEALSKTVQYEYDDLGLLSKTIETDPETNDSKTVSYTNSTIYNNDGSISKIVTTTSEGESIERSFSYDDSGKIKSMSEVSPDGTLSEKNYE
ncbi:MAG: hypothetical protein PQJ46_17610 [Spirochaetales bacterium]|nr:hypothetical protein [Spirochaetales bacterium]